MHAPNAFRPQDGAPPPPPLLSIYGAYGLLVLYTLLYVLPLYLFPSTRPSPTLSRDDPSVIRARTAVVSVSCFACSAFTLAVLVGSRHGPSLREAVGVLGYWPAGLVESAKALLLTAILFAGPLFETLVVQGAWRDCATPGPLKQLFTEWTTWRSIVVGPVTEEVLFRSASVPLLVAARAPLGPVVFASPLVFGLAHLHHFYEFRLMFPGEPVARAALRSVFQLAFTSIFGAYATFLFLRSSSLLAVVLVHAFCNSIGPPRVFGPVHPLPVYQRLGRQPLPYGPVWAWTAAYYLLLVSGAAAFCRNIWWLTDSPSALADF